MPSDVRETRDWEAPDISLQSVKEQAIQQYAKHKGGK